MKNKPAIKTICVPENALKALMNCATNTDLCRMVADETSVEFNENRFSLLFKNNLHNSYEATTTFDTTYEIYNNLKGWVTKYNGKFIGGDKPFASLDEAKDFCNEDYRERLLKISCKLV